MTVTIEEWERRKTFVRFTEQDAEVLRALKPLIADHEDTMIDTLYAHWQSFPELRSLLDDPETLQRLKITQKAYFKGLFSGDYGVAYLKNRLKVGQRHQQVGLHMRWYIGAFNNYVDIISPHIFSVLKTDQENIQRSILALYKLIGLDQELAISTYIQAREEVIQQQNDEILELSTPVVQVWEGVVMAPIIGTLDSHRTQLFMERLLEAIVATKSPIALVDITGVPAIDTATAQHLIDTINAVKLLGAQVVITGVSPSIAQTLVHLGIDLQGVLTRSSLSDGLALALKSLNLTIGAKQG